MTEPLTSTELRSPPAPQPSVSGWLVTMRAPLTLAAANFFVWPLLAGAIGGVSAQAGFTSGRLALMLWAGSVVVSAGRGLWSAARAGIAILVVDHVILKGGLFLFAYLRGQQAGEPGSNTYLMAFGGVLVSFAMFGPIAGLLGCLGGLFERRRAARVRIAAASAGTRT